MRTLSLLFLCVVSNVAVAGGNSATGKITSFSGENGNYLFRFVQTDNRSELLRGCREFEVKVTYKRVPWFSWLPFVNTSHPTMEDTIKAALFLMNANQSNREVNFGYMGSGLVSADTPCSFLSWGLSLESDYVLSFHNPV